MSTRNISLEDIRPEHPGAEVKRREFLKFSLAASGGLLIGFYFPGASKLASAQDSAKAFMPNAFVRIGTDERVVVIVNHSEMGRGVYTSLPPCFLPRNWTRIDPRWALSPLRSIPDTITPPSACR